MIYNLLISGNDELWEGTSEFIDCDRFGEYTDSILKQQYDIDNIQELKKYPCLFAYENHCKKDPKFGYINNLTVRQKKIRIEYTILPLDKFLTFSNLVEFSFDLDILDWELNRTHWAIKKIDFYSFLNSLDIYIPFSNKSNSEIVNIERHQFDVALTFLGEYRETVEQIANILTAQLGINTVFYDNYYKSQLARPSLDILIQNIYQNQANLIVVFLCEQYQEKDWCNLEFRVVRDIIKKRKQNNKIMLIKMDEGEVEGIFSTDGYINAKVHSNEDIAKFIQERLHLIKSDIEYMEVGEI